MQRKPIFGLYSCWAFGKTRNQIAHGGGEGKNKQGKQAEKRNIKNQLKPIDDAIQKLFDVLDRYA